MIFLDSNIFLRYFERKDETKFKEVEKLFTEIINGNIVGMTNIMVIAEIVWVLNKFYDWEKEEICENVEFILNTPNIKIKNRIIIQEAIDSFRRLNIDFIDCYNYSYMKSNNINQIYSYDKDYDKFDDIKRNIP